MPVHKYIKGPNSPTAGFSPRFAGVVWAGQPLFQHRESFEFYYNTKILIESMNRYEYVVFGDDGNIVASMAFYREVDMHVGDCMSVLVAFSTDTNRRALVGGYRWMREVAMELGVEWIAYTKATSTYEMTLKYKRISAHGADLSSRF